MGGFIKKIISAPKKVIKKISAPIAKKIVKAPKVGAPEGEMDMLKIKKNPEIAEVQKDAINKIKGPTTVEMADATLVKNKRKGRRITNITAKKTLDKDFKLSKKSLLG